MSRNVLLITEKHLKDVSLVETNVDPKVLSKIIQIVQVVHLQPILGKTKYDEVMNAVYELATNNTLLNDAMKELVNDYIVPYLIYATIADFIVFNNFKLTNKGLLKMTDSTSQSVQSSELEYLKNYYDNYIAVYKNRLIEHLKASEQLDRKADTDVTSYSIGWFLEK